ncbi:PRTRC system protein A [uncultured Acidovorax sp.]|uniref:PRTRC system protein A n=1 Tax=Variovorax sp. DAIF25 TaxID=3080983 RepID=UPI00076A8AAA|nr:PRTRC system protein A [uncultured Acidovorax sp.]
MGTMDPRDQALLAACPVIAAPRFGALPDMGNGQRIIVARNGWFVQTRLDWLDSIAALGHGSLPMRLPYGEVAEYLRFSFGVLPIRLIEAFVVASRESLPNEAAGVLIYSRRTGQLRLAMCEPEQTSPVHIRYRRPAMADDETVAVDLHTHGRAPAFWSGEDDREDQGIKVAGVFGLLDRPRPSACFRLVINGLYVPLNKHPWREPQGEWQEQGVVAPRGEGWMQRVLWRWRDRHLP